MATQRIDGHSKYTDGQGSGGVIGAMAEAAAAGICAIDAAYPGFTRFGFTDVQVDLQSALLDSLCGVPGRDQVPSNAKVPPYLGGQCDGKRYRVTVKGVLDRDPQNVQIVDTYSAYGPVTGIRTTEGDPTAGSVQFFCRGTSLWTQTNPPVQPPGWYGTGIIVQPIGASNHRTYSIVGTVRMDGQADTCGDPAPAYPLTPIPPGVTSKPVTVNISPNVAVTVPFVYAPIKPELAFSPQLQVEVGGLGFTFDLGGVTVDLPDINPNPKPLPGYPGIGSPTTPRPSPPGTPGGNTGGGGTGVTCPDPCPEIPPFPTDLPPQGSPITRPTNSGGEYGSPGITFLEVVLTTPPGKWAAGDGGQPVRYAGWVAFKDATGGYYPREPIAFDRSLFKAPVGAVGYTYTLTNLARGYTQYYIEQPEE